MIIKLNHVLTDKKYIEIELGLATCPNEISVNNITYNNNEYLNAIDAFKEKQIPLYITKAIQEHITHNLNTFATVNASEIIGCIKELDLDNHKAKCLIDKKELDYIAKAAPNYKGEYSNLLLGMRYFAVREDGNNVKELNIICYDIIFNYKAY